MFGLKSQVAVGVATSGYNPPRQTVRQPVFCLLKRV